MFFPDASGLDFGHSYLFRPALARRNWYWMLLLSLYPSENIEMNALDNRPGPGISCFEFRISEKIVQSKYDPHSTSYRSK